MEINPYVALGINGFCTGLGVVIANHFYTKLVKKRIDKLAGRIKKIRKGDNHE
jgi:hypothetical protein